MRKTSILAIPLLLLFVMSAAGQEPQLVEETIAGVNGDLITRSMLLRAEKGLRQDLENQYPDDAAKREAEFNRLKKRILVTLIEDKLIAQRASEIGVNADIEAQVNASILDLCKQNGVEQLGPCQALMERQGLTLEDVKANYRVQYQRQAVLGEDVYRALLDKITEREAREFYDKHLKELSEPGQIEISELFIPSTPETAAQDEEKAKQALAQLEAGKPFAEVVKAFSDPKRPSTANGGKLAPYKETDLNEDLKKELDKIAPGQVTPILKKPNGFQIVRLETRKPPTVKPFEELKDRMRQFVAQERGGAKITEYLKGLRAKALIRVADAYRGELAEADE